MSGCLSFCDIMINQLSTDPSILKCHECYVRWGVQTRPSWGSDFFKLWPKGWKRASHGEQRKNAAGGSPEVRRSLPWAQPPLSGFAKLFLPFSTAPSRSSNLQKVRAGNPPSRGVGNPVALSGAGGHRYIILLSGKCLGALGPFWLGLRDLGKKPTCSLSWRKPTSHFIRQDGMADMCFLRYNFLAQVACYSFLECSLPYLK